MVKPPQPGEHVSDNETRWEEISTISSGLQANRQPLTDALIGADLLLHRPQEKILQLSFESDTTLNQNGITHDYDAVEAAPNLFLVGFQHSNEASIATTWILDLDSGQATEVHAAMPTLEEADTSLLTRAHEGRDLSPIRVEFRQWQIGLDGDEKLEHQLTDLLIGKRIRYTYGDGGIYEHIYLNEHVYTWHCLAGPEQGLADTDACNTFAIRSNIYLFCWREKVIPTLGVVLVNAQCEPFQSNGYLMGIDTHTGKVSYFPVGAQGMLVNTTASFS